jgi:hypothetical protein
MDGLPKRIITGPDSSLKVVQSALGGKLGHLDTASQEVAVEKDQHKAGKHLILLHELIHLVAEHLKAQGIITRQPDEKFVTHLAGGLFPILALSGLWKNVSPQEMQSFLESVQDAE